jgi:hypothetical protein
VNAQESRAEVFDVFLCHNSADKPAVREIAQKLKKEGIKPWLDEEQIRSSQGFVRESSFPAGFRLHVNGDRCLITATPREAGGDFAAGVLAWLFVSIGTPRFTGCLASASFSGAKKQVNGVFGVIVRYELLDHRVGESLARLGLPSENSVTRNPFIKLVIRLPLSKRHEKDVIVPSPRQSHDSVEAPCTGTGSELRLWIEDLLDFLPRVVVIGN